MRTAEIIQKIESRIDYITFYEQRLQKFKILGDEAIALCPFHEDQIPSLSINIKTGQYYCHACGHSGNAITFIKETQNLNTNYKAIEYLCQYLGIEIEHKKIILPEKIEEMHAKLLSNAETLEYLQNERGISLEVVQRFKLGIFRDRIAIPIPDEDGNYINIRLYKPHCQDSSAKMISWEKGYGKASLFPIANLTGEQILLTEGETDCLLANGLGFNAVTVTSGAGSWRNEFNEYFKGKTVYICYDIDQAGIEGAKRVANFLSEVTDKIFIINLPISDPPNADLTDYFVKYGYTIQDFRDLMTGAVRYVREKKSERSLEYEEVSLAEASEARYYNRNIKMTIQVAGKDLSPYLIPRRVKFFCSGSLGATCKTCRLARAGGTLTIEYAQDDEELLKLIQISDSELKSLLKKRAGIPMQCNQVQYEILESLNVEEIHVIPIIDYSAEDRPYVVRVCYYVGHGIRTNRNYTMWGVTLPDPRTQHATHLIKEVKESASSIDQFRMTPELHERLKIFQIDSYQPIASDLEKITGIYARADLHLAYDLAFHSILQFYFNGKLLRKGWVECLVLGDTGTGKSQSIEAMINHYRAGEFGLGENSSFAGLVGGLQQTAKRWSLNWGKIPLNDRRLYVIDEASGLSIDEIALMSGIRSTGIAEITKIQTEKTFARTRLIWISNPRHSATLSQYGFGVLAVRDLIGKPEDIRRFDFVITCASGDVDSQLFNRQNENNGDITYNSDACNALIMWAWSRKPEQVYFTEAATKAILVLADEQGKKYSAAIPIVEAADQRIKLARLSAAMAARFFNTPDGERLIVEDKHVLMVYEFLERCYAAHSFRYDYWSEQENKRRTIKDPENLRKMLTTELAEFLMDAEVLRISDLRTIFEDTKDATLLIRRLISHRAIRRTNSGLYRKTEAFVNLLRQILATPESLPLTFKQYEEPF